MQGSLDEVASRASPTRRQGKRGSFFRHTLRSHPRMCQVRGTACACGLDLDLDHGRGLALAPERGRADTMNAPPRLLELDSAWMGLSVWRRVFQRLDTGRRASIPMLHAAAA
jgi:hypothetical protein